MGRLGWWADMQCMPIHYPEQAGHMSFLPREDMVGRRARWSNPNPWLCSCCPNTIDLICRRVNCGQLRCWVLSHKRSSRNFVPCECRRLVVRQLFTVLLL